MKEWVKAQKPANGPMTVTVTVQDGNLSAKWTVKCYSAVKAGVTEARTQAHKTLEELRAAS